MARNGLSQAAKAAGAAKLARSPKKRRWPASNAAWRRVRKSRRKRRDTLSRQKEARAAADPAGPVDRWPATRHEAVEMGMMMQVLSPGVQDGDQPNRGAEMPGIGGDDAQRLGG